jgi:hypothetical protein
MDTDEEELRNPTAQPPFWRSPSSESLASLSSSCCAFALIHAATEPEAREAQDGGYESSCYSE